MAITLFGLALGTMIDIIRERMRPEPENGISGNVRINITNITNKFDTILQQQIAGGRTDDGLYYVLFVALIIFFLYARFRSEWISILTLLTILTPSIWIGAIIRGLAKNRFTISTALYYLSLCLAFGVSSVFIESKIQTPNYTAKNFLYLQDIVTEYGLNGLRNYFTWADFHWLTFHLLGVLLFLWTCLRMILSVTNLLTVCFTLFGTADQGFFSWVLRRTIAYRLSLKNVIWTIASMIFAYYLVAGDFYMWFTYVMPQQINNIVYHIFNGTH